MLKRIESYDRLRMLADRIDVGPFDITDTGWCAYGWCERLFGQQFPQGPSEANVAYLARVTGMSEIEAGLLYIGHSTLRLGNYPGTQTGMVAELRALADRQEARVLC